MRLFWLFFVLVLVLVLSEAVLVIVIDGCIIPGLGFSNIERFGYLFDRQPIDIESIMVEDGIGHRHGLLITSTSTAASG